MQSPEKTITPRPASKIIYVHMPLPPFPISRFVTTCLRKRPLVSIKFCDNESPRFLCHPRNKIAHAFYRHAFSQMVKLLLGLFDCSICKRNSLLQCFFTGFLHSLFHQWHDGCCCRCNRNVCSCSDSNVGKRISYSIRNPFTTSCSKDSLLCICPYGVPYAACNGAYHSHYKCRASCNNQDI